MAVDHRGDLYVVDKDLEQILKLGKSDLLDDHTNATVLYSRNETESLRDPEGLFVSNDYIFWTNMRENDRYGGLHKAFIEPFPNHHVPFQEYTVKSLQETRSIAFVNGVIFFAGISFFENKSQIYGLVG